MCVVSHGQSIKIRKWLGMCFVVTATSIPQRFFSFLKSDLSSGFSAWGPISLDPWGIISYIYICLKPSPMVVDWSETETSWLITHHGSMGPIYLPTLNYIDPIKHSHSWIGKYTNQSSHGNPSWVFQQYWSNGSTMINRSPPKRSCEFFGHGPSSLVFGLLDNAISSSVTVK